MDKSVMYAKPLLAALALMFLLISCTGALIDDVQTAVKTFQQQNSFNVVQEAPAPGATNVAVNAAIDITFNSTVKQASVTGNVTLTTVIGNTPIAGNLNVANDTVTFTPTGNLTGLTEYQVKVLKAITDASGHGMANDVTWNFTTSNATAPVGTVLIDADAPYSIDSDVALTFTSTPSAGVQMRYSNSSVYADTGWEAFNTSIPSWILLSGEGTKTVYAWFKDAQGNVSNRASDTITVDSIAPINGAVLINSDAPLTNNANVTLTLYAEDPTSGLDKMRISNSSTFVDNNWEAYATTKLNWPLIAGSGTKNVYVWFKDKAGNRISTPVTDTITLDVDAPTISTRSPLAGATSVSQTTNVSVTFNENIDQSTITSSSFYVTDPDNITQYFTLTKNATGALLTSTGKLRFNIVYTVHVTTAVKDVAGNPFAGTTWTFTIKAPQLTFLTSLTADTLETFNDLVVQNDVVYIAANGTTYGQVYRVAVSYPLSLAKTNKNDITAPPDTKGIAVYGNRVYAAQDTAKLYQMVASNLSEIAPTGYGPASYVGSMLCLNYLGTPFIIDASGRFIGFSSADLRITGVEPNATFDTVGAIETYGYYSYVGDMTIDMSTTYFIRAVYTAGIGGGVGIPTPFEITGWVTEPLGDKITGIASQANDILLVAVGPSTGVIVLSLADAPDIAYQQTLGTLSGAIDISVTGNYAFVSRDGIGVGLIEVNNGDDARSVADTLSIGAGYYPTKLAAYTNASGDIYVFALSKFGVSGSVIYLRALRLD